MRQQRKIFFEGFISPDMINKKNFKLREINEFTTYDQILPLQIPQAFLVKKIQWQDFPGEVPTNTPWLAHSYWNINYSYKIQTSNQVQSRVASPKKSNSKEKKQAQKPNMPFRSQSPQRSSSQKIRTGVSPGYPPINKKILNKPQQQQAIFSKNQENSQLTKPPLSNRASSQQHQNKGIKLTVNVQAFLTKKSWVSYEQDLLLDHERGHYLLGCLCALEFKRKAEEKNWGEIEQDQLKIQIAQLLKQTLSQFFQIEKKYDEETEHYLNEEMQILWDKKIKEQILLYNAYFSQ